MHERPIIGWGIVGISVLGILTFVVGMFFPNLEYLRVSADGIEIRYALRMSRYRWDELSSFYVGRLGQRKLVYYDFSPSCHEYSAVSTHGFLVYNYGMPVEEMADYLNQWKALVEQNA